ncbi:MAG: hypothetical protein IJD74_06240 [Clostridia bacterium]|nr:hypothetical protein [Clostridia bacterium]
MNNDQNNQNNPSIEEIGEKVIRFGAILVAAAIILFCFAYTKIESPLLQMLAFGLSTLLGCVGIFIIVVIAVGMRAEKHKTNFFLYDKKKRKNIDPCELTVAEIRKRLEEFMSSFKHRGKLYIGDLFDERRHIPEHFKPLFCYEVLCQIAEGSNSQAETFLSFGFECAEVFSKYLSQNADYELASKIKTYIAEYSDGEHKAEGFCSYISEQKQSIEEKMLNYTVTNIERFG